MFKKPCQNFDIITKLKKNRAYMCQVQKWPRHHVMHELLEIMLFFLAGGKTSVKDITDFFLSGLLLKLLIIYHDTLKLYFYLHALRVGHERIHTCGRIAAING